MQNEIAYSRPVTLTNILRFAVPTIAMSVFMSFYTMVDGLFVSNLIGTSALSALNLVYPVIALVTAISTMLATGGSAAIMRKMGEGKPDEAKQDFTFLILVNVLTGLVMCGLGYLFMGKIFGSMSLSPEVSAYCWEYLSRYLLFTVPILLMNNFTLYMIAAGKASLSLFCSIAGGLTNIVLDYLFIAVFRWGIGGAAVATGLGYSITAIVGLLVFSNRNSLLHFVRPVCRPQTLGRAVTNGCSEMATALVNGIITLMTLPPTGSVEAASRYRCSISPPCASSVPIQSKVDAAHAVGKRADGNHVHTGGGHLWHTFQRHVTAGFHNGVACDKVNPLACVF